MNFNNKKVIGNVTVDGINIEFDPDSTKEAWKHYRIVYFNDEGECRILNNYFLDDLDRLVLCKYKNKKYYNEYDEKSQYNRYYLLSGDISEKYPPKADYPGERANLSGECDFNFNEEKLCFYKELINEEFKQYPRMHKLTHVMLEECKKTHHTLLNFSLMQTKGNMQKFKGVCLKNGKSSSLDRADSLVAYLYKYYLLGDSQKEDPCILKNAGPNKQILKEYLNLFNDVFDYCKKIYLIDDEDFVKRMIAEGNLSIENGRDVIRYMILALEFWDRKEVTIKKIYKKENSK